MSDDNLPVDDVPEIANETSETAIEAPELPTQGEPEPESEPSKPEPVKTIEEREQMLKLDSNSDVKIVVTQWMSLKNPRCLHYYVDAMRDEQMVFQVGGKLTNFDNEEYMGPLCLHKYQTAMQLLTETLISAEFREYFKDFPMLSRRRGGPASKKVIEGYDEVTGDVVLDDILSGQDWWDKTEDHDIQIWVILSKLGKRTIGCTWPNTRKSKINYKFAKKESFTVGSVSSNIIHEYMHNIGYAHSYGRTNWRGRTVPYRTGSKAKAFILKRLKEVNPQPEEEEVVADEPVEVDGDGEGDEGEDFFEEMTHSILKLMIRIPLMLARTTFSMIH